MVKAIIFDCFGVIYPDTLYLATRKYIDVTDKDMSRRINAIRSQSDKGLISREEFWDTVADTIGVSSQKLNVELKKVRRADWELLNYIKDLKQKYKTGLLSNVGRGFLEQIFDKTHPQTDYFDVVMASGDMGFVKPDKRAYHFTAEKLGVKPENCIMIDDLPTNCAGARDAGMQAILYKDITMMKEQLEIMLKV